MNRLKLFLLTIFSISITAPTALAQYNPESFSAMKWRLSDPHRAGRVTCVAGIPGKPSTQTGFGALSYPTSHPTGLLGVGLGGDSSPRMIAFQARLEF